MPGTDHRLQVLIANEHDDRLKSITAVVEGLGHEVVASGVGIGDVGPLSQSTGAEVALVGWALMASTPSTRSPRSSVKQLVPSSRFSMPKTRATCMKRPNEGSSPTSF